MIGGSLSLLEFDSQVFGVRFFRVASAGDAKLGKDLSREKGKGPLIADAKIDAGDIGAEQRLVDLGFRRVSTQITLTASVSGETGNPRQAQVLDSLVLDAADVAAHAASFRFSRFLQDPMLPREDAVRFMETWIANSLNGRRSVVAIGRNFCTYRLGENALEIDLLSCLDRRAGIATKLLSEIRRVASDAGLPAVQVTTEAENIAAMRTYILSGYVPSVAMLAMHLVHRPRTDT